MRLEEALEYYRAGHKIRRLSWKDRKAALGYSRGGLPCMHCTDNSPNVRDYVDSEDILADDWDVTD